MMNSGDFCRFCSKMINLLEKPELLGAFIAEHRRQAGLSRVELALRADVGKTILYDLEHGRTSVRLDLLMRILTVLGMQLHLSGPFVRGIDRLAEGDDES
ncbi:helix-turn-helix domain protein [Leptonema illini DSM 21528]|jgi:transcriptional regulator with XRE-family HTH domain|uniref:Helix-turn-helix domain protein n=2 Tax=Leptonema illini TaxID=183 RepID=H2CDF6_9LEPT|nr:helix-turn-helix domain protein [Leptonema illini DSM 21528]